MSWYKRRRPAFSPSERQQILAKNNGRCWWCNVELEYGYDDKNRNPRWFTVDHVVALANGGAHSIENAVPACRRCNSSKGARIADDSCRSAPTAAQGAR